MFVHVYVACVACQALGVTEGVAELLTLKHFQGQVEVSSCADLSLHYQ